MTATPPAAAAAEYPVARVLPLLGLPQLDRPFDYYVPKSQAEAAQVGVRVRIRFHGQLVNGIILERRQAPAHDGPLSFLKDVISPEVVYPKQLRQLVESLAQYYGATRSDIIRAAIPSRHARAERARSANSEVSWEDLGTLATVEPDLDGWQRYAFGASFISSVLSGAPARAAWQPLPGEDTERLIVALAVTVARAGAGVLIVVPDGRTLDRFDAAFRELISPRQVTILGSNLGPESRYRRYLDILHGQGRIVLGTRSAAYAPVHNLGLAVLVGDGDDNLVDPRAPYIHAREVLVTRSALEASALMFVSPARTAEVQQLVESKWAHNLIGHEQHLAAQLPEIIAARDTVNDPESGDRGRLPAVAFKKAKESLRQGLPVLVQVPRRGYILTLSCRRCGTAARCRWCNGPLGIPASAAPDQPAPPTCRWCGRIDVHHRCHHCGSDAIRPRSLGSSRTAEEFGRIFSPHPVVDSSGERIIDEIAEGPRVVVATPSAAPRAPQGYGTVLLLDAWVMLQRQDMRADEDAIAAWAAAAALARPHSEGGAVIIDADAAAPAVANLLRWDVVGAAEQILRDRGAAGLPPVEHFAAVDGTDAGLRSFMSELHLPEGAEVLGPVELPWGARPPAGVEPGTPISRMLVRVPRSSARALGEALKAAQAVRAAKKEPGAVRVIVNPVRFG